MATTSSSALAVKISGVRLLAIQRSAGLSSSRPPRMMSAITPTTRAAFHQPFEPSAACRSLSTPKPASSGTRARIGIAATSCSSATLSTLRPEVVPIRLRSASTARPIAVDDIARPSAATQASGRLTPAASARPAMSAAEPSSCTLPQPKTAKRIAHSRFGSSSRPTTKSISTTPNSAKCSVSSAPPTSRSP